MKKFILILLALTLFLAVSASAVAESDFLGKPFPDFTVKDIDGNTFSLSEALNDHEAVMINLWATYCGPCIAEFPEINKVYEEYKDKVAFIALSTYPADTDEVIAEFRRNNNLTLPMGRDEGQKIIEYTHSQGIPTTVIIDRFGNAVFCQIGSFRSADDIIRTLDLFLGDQYSETVVQYGVPKDTSTVAVPVSSARAIRFDNPSTLKASLLVEGGNFIVCAVNDNVAHIRLEVTESDVLSGVCFYDSVHGYAELKDLYDPERGILVRDIEIPDNPGELNYVDVCLLNYDLLTSGADDPDMIDYYLVRSAEDIDAFQTMLKGYGYAVIGSEFLSDEAPQAASGEAYKIHVADQNGDPVPGVTVNFCTDVACVPRESDENGTITYDGAPDAYHVQVIDVPDGYSCDESFEMYTPKAYGEWTLRIHKD